MFNPFKKTYTHQELMIFRFLSKVKLFEKLSFKDLHRFLPHLHEREFKKDEVVFFRNDPSNALYIIRSGKVSLSIDIREKLEHLTEVRTNMAFGDNSLLKTSRRIYNALVVSEKANFYVIPKGSIMEIFDHHPEIKAKMLESLAELYNSYTENVFKTYKSSFGFFSLTEVYQER
jgi:CRP/FNR family transcriptional regulator, cyclic AMP receptor protein